MSVDMLVQHAFMLKADCSLFRLRKILALGFSEGMLCFATPSFLSNELILASWILAFSWSVVGHNTIVDKLTN